ncbi:MAG: hypothetical protein KDD64_05650 [Bdellovibrionales bacterium]|nr:hypothetical protein [Bdellovibrionales bacterium]
MFEPKGGPNSEKRGGENNALDPIREIFDEAFRHTVSSVTALKYSLIEGDLSKFCFRCSPSRLAAQIGGVIVLSEQLVEPALNEIQKEAFSSLQRIVSETPDDELSSTPEVHERADNALRSLWITLEGEKE